MGHADPLGVEPAVEALGLPLLVAHPLVEDDRRARRQPEQLADAPEDPGSELLVVERRRSATGATTCEYQPDASTRVAAEQRDAEERVERQHARATKSSRAP